MKKPQQCRKGGVENIDFCPGRIIWKAEVPLDDIKEVVEAEALPKDTTIQLSMVTCGFHTLEELSNLVDLCHGHGYTVFVETDLPKETSAYAVTPHDAIKIGADKIIVGTALAGDELQGKLVDRIGPNYGRLIENIQLDR